VYLAEIACGNFSGHYFVARGQKAWFLPGAPSPLRWLAAPAALRRQFQRTLLRRPLLNLEGA
jgi:hypothetical protein